MTDIRNDAGEFPTPQATPADLKWFEQLTRRRRATRHFTPDTLPAGLLDRLLDVSRWAPSGYNLQPTHFVAVTDPSLRAKLRPACMDQKQVEEAPAVILITGDKRVASRHLDQVLQMDREAGSMTDDYERLLRRVVPLAFNRGPLGLNLFWKATILPIVRLIRPIPVLPAVERRYWLAKQTMLSAMTLMLAAEAAGLNSLPMEGFDERRVRRVLGIPRSHVVTLIVCLGYSATPSSTKTRVPFEQIIHHNGW